MSVNAKTRRNETRSIIIVNKSLDVEFDCFCDSNTRKACKNEKTWSSVVFWKQLQRSLFESLFFRECLGNVVDTISYSKSSKPAFSALCKQLVFACIHWIGHTEFEDECIKFMPCSVMALCFNYYYLQRIMFWLNHIGIPDDDESRT